jgi:hypothetical protein
MPQAPVKVSVLLVLAAEQPPGLGKVRNMPELFSADKRREPAKISMLLALAADWPMALQ